MFGRQAACLAIPRDGFGVAELHGHHAVIVAVFCKKFVFFGSIGNGCRSKFYCRFPCPNVFEIYFPIIFRRKFLKNHLLQTVGQRDVKFLGYCP